MFLHRHAIYPSVCFSKTKRSMKKIGTEILVLNVRSQESQYNLMFPNTLRPPLWSSGQSSWLQIRRHGFDSRHYQIF
jgi:hypothetical protein